MDELLSRTLAHLGVLVAARTENPPRRTAESGVLGALVAALGPGFATRVVDLGGGSISLLATRGAPRVLWNFHIDTVPATGAWGGDPFVLRVDGERATGLGACDTKGAAAAMLAAASVTGGDAALLFTSDEEAGQARCVRAFLDAGCPFEGVVVAEPTGCRAVLAHRAVGTALGRFTGRAGHSSTAAALSDSAVHQAIGWAHAALRFAEGAAATGGELAGLRFNLGRIEGGEKPNVVAAAALVRFGIRPPPGVDPVAALAELQALAPDAGRVAWERGFVGPPLPATAALLDEGRELAARLGLPVGPAVDFWTEAALFSERGIPALVYGPGSITLAHAADEWVPLAALAEAARTYARLLTGE